MLATERQFLLRSARMSAYIAPDSQDDFYLHLKSAFESGERQICEVQLLTPDGLKLWVQLESILVSFDDESAHVRTAVIDIEKRKTAEKESQRLLLELQHAQKLESLGVLAGGIAHDFNNMLVAILGNTSLALHKLPKSSDVREELEDAVRAAEQCQKLTNQMLAYSGRGQFALEDVELQEAVGQMSSLLKTCVGKGTRLTIDLPSSLAPIQADPSQVHQIVMNLVLNAAEAIGSRSGQITVRANMSRCGTGCPCRAGFPGASSWPEVSCVALHVVDTGDGIDATTLEQIFEPFFTTKFTGRGLGLAAVYGILRGLHAGIHIVSTPGEGASFTVHFPALDRPAVDKMATWEPMPVSYKMIGTVLLVDDEESVLRVTKRILESQGLSVITARDGQEGVDVFRERMTEIDCVLLDLTMPRMDGEQALGNLRELRPDIPVLLSSGFSESEVVKRFVGKGLTGFVGKPYNFDELLSAVHRILC